MADEFKRMRQLVGSNADWSLSTLILGDGEIAFEREGDVIRAKLGDGSKTYTEAPYFTESLWKSSGTYTFNRIDGPVVVGATTGPDRFTVRGGDFSVGVYREDIPTTGQHLGIVRLGALEATSAPVTGGLIRGEATEDWSATAHGTRIRISITPNGATAETSVLTIEPDGGLVMEGATGGSQGPGTINATAVYVNGVALTP